MPDNNKLLEIISIRLKQLMSLNQLNAETLASNAQVSVSSIYRMRSGKPPLPSETMLEQLEFILGASLTRRSKAKANITSSLIDKELKTLSTTDHLRLLVAHFTCQKTLADALGIAPIHLSHLYNKKSVAKAPLQVKIYELARTVVSQIDDDIYQLFLRRAKEEVTLSNIKHSGIDSLCNDVYRKLHTKYKYPLSGLHQSKSIHCPILSPHDSSQSITLRPDILCIENKVVLVAVYIWHVSASVSKQTDSSEFLSKLGALAAMNPNVGIIISPSCSYVYSSCDGQLKRLEDIPVYSNEAK